MYAWTGMKFNVLAMKRAHNNAMKNNRKQARIISAVTEYFGVKYFLFSLPHLFPLLIILWQTMGTWLDERVLSSRCQNKPNTPPNAQTQCIWGDRLCSLITSSNHSHTHSIMDPTSEIKGGGVGGYWRGQEWIRSPRKFRLCLQMDSVCMNKHRPRKTSLHLHIEWGKAPFAAPPPFFPTVTVN